MRWFGLVIGFEPSWFIWTLTAGGRISLAFMHPDHPPAPPGAEYERVRAAGASISYDLHDEPLGRRRFKLSDPLGTWIDVVQQIEPAVEWWDK